MTPIRAPGAGSAAPSVIVIAVNWCQNDSQQPVCTSSPRPAIVVSALAGVCQKPFDSKKHAARRAAQCRCQTDDGSIAAQSEILHDAFPLNYLQEAKRQIGRRSRSQHAGGIGDRESGGTEGHLYPCQPRSNTTRALRTTLPSSRRGLPGAIRT